MGDKNHFERNGIRSTVWNMDCIEGMAKYGDNHFDLAIVDPPYGIGITKSGRLRKYNNANNHWDDLPPKKEYFELLFRISKNQIIWGGNYFSLPPHEMFYYLG